MSNRIAVDAVHDDLFAAITKAADAAGLSRSQWMRGAAVQRLASEAKVEADPLATVSATLAEAKATVDAVRRGGQ
jgi:hypothetical protein